MRRVLTLSLIAATALAITLACSREGRADAGSATQSVAAPLWRELPAATPAAGPTAAPVTTLAPLIKQLKPAVVNISTTTVTKGHPRVPGYPRGGPQGGQGGQGPGGQWEEFFERFYGQPRDNPDFRSNSLGSGFIINRDGYILTNNHVVGDATEIKVKLSDGREFMAKVVGKDPPTDVALIRLEKAPHDLPTVALGDSDALEQGDFVLALGNPFGLSGSASFGMVSAKARSLQNGPFDDFIQTDAAINPGNSGGPLFNMKGEVVGINTAIVSPQIGQGIGFAVPISLAKQLLPQLEKGTKIARGYLGVTVGDLTPELARGFGLGEGVKGAVVQDVIASGPASKGGVKAGDVVTAVNGKPVEDRGQLTRAIASISPGRQGQPERAPEGQEAGAHRDRRDPSRRGRARPGRGRRRRPAIGRLPRECQGREARRPAPGPHSGHAEADEAGGATSVSWSPTWPPTGRRRARASSAATSSSRSRRTPWGSPRR